MSIGTLTERGIVIMQAPILASGADGVGIMSLLKGKTHPKIAELAASLKRLKEIDSLKGIKAVKAQHEKENTLHKIIKVLKSTEHLVHDKTFNYSSDQSLLDA
jgi:exopolysaccharide biosynthesis protein